ncbi:MAG: DUF4844 domain-containing protein [Bacteroidetes bacterium]|nr:DUF4844 domain-containing protein [Bacteroidota bacterium]
MTKDQIAQLDSLKNTYKFTDKDWDARGLIPSAKSMSDNMDGLLNECLSDLVALENKDLTDSELKNILNRGLKRFNKLDYDTEGREFIADKFNEISKILRIDFNEDLNIWLYGRLIVKLRKIFNKEDSEIIESMMIQCTKCQDTLTKAITRIEENIPEYWTVVKCNKCGELNLFPAERNIKESRFINCTWIQSFAESEFDSIQINKKLNELKINN